MIVFHYIPKTILVKRRDQEKCLVKNLIPIKAIDYRSVAERPQNSVLSTEKIQDCFNIMPTDWRDELNGLNFIMLGKF
jgi:dTDP-4-dehydrorhamnose reductase